MISRMPANMNETICENMTEIARNPYLNALLAFYLIVGTIATPVISASIYAVLDAPGYHFNTKVLLVGHLLAMLCHCLARSFSYLVDLIKYHSHFQTGCDILPDFEFCFVTRFLLLLGYAWFEWTSIILFFERTLATIYRKTYENNYKRLSVALVSLQALLTFFTLVSWYWYFEPKEVRYFCKASEKSSPFLIVVVDIAVLFALFASRIGFKILILKNEQLRHTEASANLSCRFQMEENIRSNRILKLFADYDFYFLCFYNVASIVVYTLAVDWPMSTYIIFSEGSLLCPIYSLIVPCALYIKYSRDQKKTAKKLEISINVSHSEYFQHFEKVWKLK